ncbi:MAG: hypothetical protein ACO3AD_20015, partial [Burkholderiaceae bacterium]
VDLAATKGREGELAQAVRSFAGLYGVSFSDYSGVRRVLAGDRVRVGAPDYTTFDRPERVLTGERVEIKGDLGGIPHNSLYEYIGKTPLEGPQLDRVDYSDTSTWRKINGIAGKTYVFKGLTASLDLGVENYEDNSRWLGLDLDDFVDTAAAAAEAVGALAGSDKTKDSGGASAFGGLVVRNDVRSDEVSSVQGFEITVTGDVSVTATGSSVILARDTSVVEAQATGVNVVVATNTVLGEGNAWLRNNTVHTTADSDPSLKPEDRQAGDLKVKADNTAFILAELDSSVKASTSVGVVLAFNTIGYAPQNVLFNVLDGVLGTSLAGMDSLKTVARIDETPIEVDGSLSVSAGSTGQIQALISNSALALNVSKSGASNSISVAPVVAMNKLASEVQAKIDQTDSVVTRDDITVHANDSARIQSEVAASAIGIAASTTSDSKAVSVGLSLTRNDVQSDVSAFIRGRGADAPAQITSNEGSISIETQRGASIAANGRATAVAVAASLKGGSTAVSGAGTLAQNRTMGDAQAFAQWVNLTTEAELPPAGSASTSSTAESAAPALTTQLLPADARMPGDVTIRVQDDTLIDAYLRSVAASVSVGLGGSATAAAIGLSVARNLIGQAPQTVPFDLKASQYSKPALLKELTKGKRVLHDTASTGSSVYEYLGSDLKDDKGIDLVNQNYSDTKLWRIVSDSESYDFKASSYRKAELLKKLAKGQLVQHDTALLSRDIYEYVGPELNDDEGIDLVNQNYSDESHWRLVSYMPRVAITQAQILDGSVTATGELTIEAASRRVLPSTVRPFQTSILVADIEKPEKALVSSLRLGSLAPAGPRLAA